MRDRIAVIGGGLQGTLVALACAARGLDVTLFERSTALFCGASRNNEGKIHLGYTYGLDGTGATQRLMARNGAAFFDALRSIVPETGPDIIVAREVLYARHRDSLLSEDATAQHLAHVSQVARAASPAPLRRDQLRSQFGDAITSAHAVPEITVDPGRLCEVVASAVGRSAIAVRLGSRVDRIMTGPRPSVFTGDGREAFDIIVNCAWDGLPRLDATCGLPAAGFCLRAKAAFVTQVLSGMPRLPLTFCYGSFGDVVPLGGDRAYLSWYPACLMAFTTDVASGTDWFDVQQSRFDFGEAYSRTVAAFSALCPDMSLAAAYDNVLAGPILAYGRTDIDDGGSALHRRTEIGIRRAGPVFSVNPGKLTCAPQFALELGAMLA